MAGRALPSHLKPSAAEGGEGGFAPRHHGKTQSHVVSRSLFPQLPSHIFPLSFFLYDACSPGAGEKLSLQVPMALPGHARLQSRAGALSTEQAGEIKSSGGSSRPSLVEYTCSSTSALPAETRLRLRFRQFVPSSTHHSIAAVVALPASCPHLRGCTGWARLQIRFLLPLLT